VPSREGEPGNSRVSFIEEVIPRNNTGEFGRPPDCYRRPKTRTVPSLEAHTSRSSGMEMKSISLSHLASSEHKKARNSTERPTGLSRVAALVNSRYRTGSAPEKSLPGSLKLSGFCRVS